MSHDHLKGFTPGKIEFSGVTDDPACLGCGVSVVNHSPLDLRIHVEIVGRSVRVEVRAAADGPAPDAVVEETSPPL